MGALDDVLVVSLEHAVAAPFATRQLADNGARVIKVERIEGGDFARSYDERVRGLSSHFVWCNRSKESLALDLKSAEGLAALKVLVAKSDVLVQNLAPGAAARMGLDYATLAELHPRLIVCDISGYGQSGPYELRKAYDLLIQAESGFLSISGTPESPAKAGCSIADIAAGMYAYSNILTALIERSRTGKGRHIDISMLEAMSEWMSYPLYYAFDGAAPPLRAGASHASIYPYGPFPTADGDVVLGVQNDREWISLCTHVLAKPELAIDPRFVTNSLRTRHRDALDAVIGDCFRQLSRAQVTERLDRAQIANANVNTMADLWIHPQLKARDRWVEIGTPAGAVPALLPPGMGQDARMDAVPALGEQTDKILRELLVG